MPNNVELKLWLLSRDGTALSDKQVEDFFSQFITVIPKPAKGVDSRLFDFNTLKPQPENIWHGSIGGIAEKNLEQIKEYGGIEKVKQVLKEKDYPIGEAPCLTEEQIVEFGMVNWYDWNKENWGTKWGAYYCEYDWSARHGGAGRAQVAFCTAWNVPEELLRMIRNIALKQGYEIECEFCGETDYPGVYSSGQFMYWNAKWNEETEELERIGEPIDVHC
jgi:hypothetical protein